MKISYKTDYALKAVLELSLRFLESPQTPVSIQEIAKIGDMPIKYLEQILLLLKRGKFLKSRRGAGGGFFLARRPEEITIGEIIRYIEGPIGPISCVEDDHYKGCKDVRCCLFKEIWKDVKHSISVIIDTVTFEELVLKLKRRDPASVNLPEYMI